MAPRRLSAAFAANERLRGSLTHVWRPRVSTPICATFAICLGVPASVWSQTGIGGDIASSVEMSARVSVSQVYTSNVFLSSRPRSELITEVSPGIRISSKGGRIQGALDYSLTEQIYARNTSGSRSQNALNATGLAEVVDNWAFVDFSGVVSQQAVSAFGAPLTDGSSINGNSTEVSTFRVSPFVRGRFGSAAEYTARYSLTSTKSASSAVSDVDIAELSLSLGGTGARRGLGWNLAGSRQTADYSLGRSTVSQRISAYLGYPIDERFGVYVRANDESNDFTSASALQATFVAVGLNWTPNEEASVSIDRNNKGVIGIDADWHPSKRTSVSVQREQRLYGNTHRIALAYRTQSTAWTFSSSRSANTDSGSAAAGKPPDLYALLLDQYSASELDSVKREQYASFLQANGIRPGATAVTGFQTSAVSVQRQNQLSAALFGSRNTLTFVASSGSSSRLDSQTTAIDDFSISPTVKQTGLSINLSHRFTPQTVLNVLASRQLTSGSTAQLSSTLRSVFVNLTTQLTKDTSAGVGLRRVVFDSATNPYTETAVTGNFNVQF